LIFKDKKSSACLPSEGK